MLCVTHEMGFAHQVADRVIFMDQGRIIEQSSSAEFFDTPSSAKSCTEIDGPALAERGHLGLPQN